VVVVLMEAAVLSFLFLRLGFCSSALKSFGILDVTYQLHADQEVVLVFNQELQDFSR
jgi:hypothetical protein